MPKMSDIDKQNMMKSIAIVSYGEKDTASLLVFFPQFSFITIFLSPSSFYLFINFLQYFFLSKFINLI